jgi:dihydroorotase
MTKQFMREACAIFCDIWGTLLNHQFDMATLETLLIQNATAINEGTETPVDILIKGGIIDRIAHPFSIRTAVDTKIDAQGMWLLPGVIDDQVHFREPGMTHKADIASESRAAVAGGITSYMEMPNTQPAATTMDLVLDKYKIAEERSVANFAFYIGGTNDNIQALMQTDPTIVPGIKLFMGSSTGSLLVDDPASLDEIFRRAHLLIATHCEHEPTVRANMAAARETYGANVPIAVHPQIRSAEACYLSSSFAVNLAKQYNTRLHVLHISTAHELDLFQNNIPLAQKRITAEACIHHLWFNDQDYATKGARIKWNPAVKTEQDRLAILAALQSGKIDVIATDHAPHTLEEKSKSYFEAPSGGPLVQHALVATLEWVHRGELTLPFVVEKMCHAPAELFQVDRRGYIREGYYADLVLVAPKQPWKVEPSNIRYKCGWSPFEGTTFQSQVRYTLVNGQLKYANGHLVDERSGMALRFNRS